jgi:hypothetical protein
MVSRRKKDFPRRAFDVFQANAGIAIVCFKNGTFGVTKICSAIFCPLKGHELVREEYANGTLSVRLYASKCCSSPSGDATLNSHAPRHRTLLCIVSHFHRRSTIRAISGVAPPEEVIVRAARAFQVMAHTTLNPFWKVSVRIAEVLERNIPAEGIVGFRLMLEQIAQCAPSTVCGSCVDHNGRSWFAPKTWCAMRDYMVRMSYASGVSGGTQVPHPAYTHWKTTLSQVCFCTPTQSIVKTTRSTATAWRLALKESPLIANEPSDWRRALQF